jgi:hypothetical protein
MRSALWALWLISLGPRTFLVVCKDGALVTTEDPDYADAWPTRESAWRWVDEEGGKARVAAEIGPFESHSIIVVRKGGKRGE